MPNIELYGYSGPIAHAMREKIRAALESSPSAAEIVTTTIPLTDVQDLKGKKMPYLRIITSQDGLPDLEERLAPLGEDIEVIFLGKWIPKKE